MQNHIVYKQIPLNYSGIKCHFCQEQPVFKKPVKIVLINSKLQETTMITANLLYCQKCDICYASPEMFSELSSRIPGYIPSHFKLSKKVLLKDAKKKAFTFSKEYNHIYDIRHPKKKQRRILSKASYYVQHYNEMRQAFRNERNALIMIILKSKPNIDAQEKALIVSNRTEAICEYIDILDYKTSTTRELLTRIIRFQEKTIYFNGLEYNVVKVMEKAERELIRPDFIPEEIIIRKGGGYPTSQLDNAHEYVQVLLFSPYTQKYELASATFDKDEFEYYMDATVYRNFIRYYGNPKIKVFAGSTQNSSDEFFDG